MKETELLVKASITTRHSTNFQARFVRREKSLLKVAAIKKGDLSISCSFEGKCIDFGANKPKLRRFEIRSFCDKMRPFVQFQRVPFGKSTQHSFKCDKLKCSNSEYPSRLSVSPRKDVGPHGEREKISDPGEVRTHDLRNRSPLLY